MDTSDMIDLGREYEPMACCSGSDKPEKKVSYPTLYVREMDEIPDLPKGDFYIMCKVCVSRISIDAKEGDNCLDLEVKAMKIMGEAEEEQSEEAYEMNDLLEGGSAARLAKNLESYDEGEE